MSQRGATSEDIPEVPLSSKGTLAISGKSGPVQGLTQTHSDLVSWLHQPHGATYDELVSKVESNGLKREHLAYALGALVSLYLITGHNAVFLCNLAGFIYPAYISLKAIKLGNVSNVLFLLIYWVVFAFLVLVDNLPFSKLPMYFFIKAVFLVFMCLPQTQGALLVYNRIIEPITNSIEGLLNKKNV